MAQVRLLTHTPNPERVIASIAAICYGTSSATDNCECFTLDRSKKMITKLLESNHLSPFEHASFTFEIDHVSRACTHQLVRHRLASYTQQSQRYVDQKSARFIEPDVDDADNADKLLKAARDSFKAYSKLVENGVPKEDARYVLPEGAETRIVVTMNVRELLHFFELRCCSRAQKEIRDVANEMLAIAKDVAPTIFGNAGPACVSLGFCNESNPCKKNQVSLKEARKIIESLMKVEGIVDRCRGKKGEQKESK